MHELSIAMGIVRIAEDEARKARASKVSSIELEIGFLSGVEMDSLEYVWPVATRGTVLENARKEIHRPKGKGICLDCDTEFTVHQHYDPCPTCNGYLKSIVQGKELRVRAIEVEN